MRPFGKKANRWILLLCGILMILPACKAASEKQVDGFKETVQNQTTRNEAIQKADDKEKEYPAADDRQKNIDTNASGNQEQNTDWDSLCKRVQMLPQDFTFVVDINDGATVTVCGQKMSMQNQIITPSMEAVSVNVLRSETFFPLQETFDLIGIAWDIQNDVLSMACQYHIEADYGKNQPHLCSIDMQTLRTYDRDGVSYMTLSQKAQEQNGVLYIPLSWLEQLFAFHVTDTKLILDTEQYLAKQPIKSDDGTLKNWVNLSQDEIPERFVKTQTEDRNGISVEVWSDGSLELRVFEGINSVFSVTLLDDSHETKRGVRVGDSVDQLWEWYLEQQLDGMVTRLGKEESKQNQDAEKFALIPYVLSYTQEDGFLTSITISAPE